ncbi:hypothetical protein T492DRAFT_937878, partial [Pavlovales sp. CCMP2436]
MPFLTERRAVLSVASVCTIASPTSGMISVTSMMANTPMSWMSACASSRMIVSSIIVLSRDISQANRAAAATANNRVPANGVRKRSGKVRQIG